MAKGRKIRSRRLVMPPIGRSVERHYRAYLLRIVNRNDSLIRKRLLSVAQALLVRHDSASDSRCARDDALDYMSYLVDEVLKDSLDGIKASADKELLRLLSLLAHKHKRAFTEALKRHDLQINLLDDDALAALFDERITKNLQLIESLSERHLRQAGEVCREGIATGTRPEDIAKEIKERTGVAKSRAMLIARDQIHKTLGQIEQKRQQDLGIEHYIWRTSRDEAVRETHKALDGLRFSWHSPPEVGHPRQDYQCRCSADPDIGELIYRLKE